MTLPLPQAQHLTGPDSNEVDLLVSKYCAARRRFDNLVAIGCAERILAIYESHGIDIPALDEYRRFLKGGEWSNAT